jgi:hypothetical protein
MNRLERNDRVETNNDSTNNEEAREGSGSPVFDFWSDEGARIYNEILDEGSTYTSANVLPSDDCDDYPNDEVCEYRDPEMYDPEEETLPPGEIELIFENSYLM